MNIWMTSLLFLVATIAGSCRTTGLLSNNFDKIKLECGTFATNLSGDSRIFQFTDEVMFREHEFRDFLDRRR